MVYDPEAMVDFINQTTSRFTLGLELSGNLLSEELRLKVVEALASNAHIDFLILGFGRVDDVEMFPNALQALHQNTTLKSLWLNFYSSARVPGRLWYSLLKSGPPLRDLDLCNVLFDGCAIGQLLNGLISRDTAIHLGLYDCFFSDDALDTLIRVLPTVAKHCLLSLTIVNPRYRRDYPELNTLAEALYSLPPFRLEISLDENETCALLGKLTSKSPPWMTSLVLHNRLRLAETEALVAFVKSAVHLEMVSAQVFDHVVNAHAMVEEAARENGSLIRAYEGPPCVYNRRNANLRLLLVQRPMPLELENLSLMPSLFQAAKAAKKMAANFIFAGLLGCDHLDNVHHRGQLRMRPVSDLE
jgi:hypothetical protein